jgi:2-isopropylmalate synthase
MKTDYILLDQTLREGEQQSGIRFSAEQKIAILHHLEDFGFTLVEIGHPGISEEDERICRKTAEAARRAQILMHARANVDEIRAAKRAKADWVGIWASLNDIALATKFVGHDADAVTARVRNAVAEAKHLGLKVRFTIEDASRTPWPAIEAIARVALAAGADRISLADTTGTWDPQRCGAMVAQAAATLGCEIEVHLHNDLGLAHANALAAIDAGATVVDTSVLGVGERAGIVDSLELAVSLNRLRGDNRFDLGRIPRLARAVRRATGHRPDALRPVIGLNAFTHTSAYHVRAVRKNPEAYEAYPPELVGRRRTIEPERPPVGQPMAVDALAVGTPFVKGASELQYHRDGPGVRWVLMDSRVDQRTSLYVIQRFFGLHSAPIVPENHVDSHAHHCDSVFIFWGDQPDGSGLVCEVQLEDECMTVASPASVFIPAEMRHSYHYVSGRGTYTNIVLAPEYNRSLLPPDEEKLAKVS